MTDKSCVLHSKSRWQNGIGGGGEFAGSKMVWVSNTDWKGHISKTITCVPLEVVVCVFYSEFTSVLFYNWEWREGKKIDLCKPQVRAVLHTQVDAVIYVLSSLKMIKYASSFGLITSHHVGRASGMR